jgi:hypothetical protein
MRYKAGAFVGFPLTRLSYAGPGLLAPNSVYPLFGITFLNPAGARS